MTIELWVLAILFAAAGGTLLSFWRQYSYSLVASIACVFTLIVMVLVGQSDWGTTLYQVGFSPHDLTGVDRLYTLLTSVFSHASFLHLFFNVLVILFVGVPFEQKVGTRPFIGLYLLSGLVGTLVFAAVRWDSGADVVGASGAVFGVLGAYARLYPNERMSLFFLPPMRLLTIVGILFVFQFLIMVTSPSVAFEAHLGGLAAGLALAPVLAKRPATGAVKKPATPAALNKFATTPELKSILKMIEEETVPDVRNAWIEHFLSKVKCPHCGSQLRITKDSVMCEKGHLL